MLLAGGQGALSAGGRSSRRAPPRPSSPLALGRPRAAPSGACMDSGACAEPAATPAQLRRLAGGADSAALIAALAIEAWRGDALDACRDASGKNPLHFAAWRGAAENVEALLALGCDIDASATGLFSFGKTPLFFAVTRCRDDVVDLLLERGANTRIVNNKGQSPRSLAASHLQAETLQRLISREDAEARNWINFRKTHSDGLLYGDLDARFMEEADLAGCETDVCLEPTTAQSRRGAFERRNGRALGPTKAPAAPQVSRKRTVKKALGALPERQRAAAEAALGLVQDDADGALARFVEAHAGAEFEWLPGAADQLRGLGCDSALAQALARLDDAALRDSDADRQERRANKLLARLLRRALGIADEPPLQTAPPRPPAAYLVPRPLWPAAPARGAALPAAAAASAAFVDSPEALQQMRLALAAAKTVAFDVEFDDAGACTIQLAMRADAAWVLDAREPRIADGVRDAVRDLFSRGDLRLVGFAVREDVKVLRKLAGAQVESRRVVDVQVLALRRGVGDCRSAPSLATVFAAVCHQSLDKALQRSDWAQRPLSQNQLRYAALDAACLLRLLPALAGGEEPQASRNEAATASL